MHHPGPPRVTSVGSPVELAPRSPDPDATYNWSLAERPDGSRCALGDDPVTWLDPDEPGTYVAALETPGTTERLTVRAFPDERRDAAFVLPESDLPVDREAFDRISVGGPFNEWRFGRDRPTWVPADDRDAEEGAYVLETRLPPGEHEYRFAVDDAWDEDRMAGGTLSVDGPGRPRVHLGATVDGGEVVLEAHAAPPPGSDGPVDVEFLLDDRDDLSRSALDVGGRTARLPVDAVGEQARLYAVPVAERHGTLDGVSLAREDGDLTAERLNDPPEWARDAVVYEIFVRSFVGGRTDATFDGIRRRLDYLSWLGVDTVWFTPVVAGPTEHGYHATDLLSTAADLGSRAAFEELVEACHERGLRVVFDLVVNHTAREHPFFQLSAAGVDGYRDHYVWETGPDGERRAERYFDWSSIPNLNHDSLAVRAHLLEVVDEWVDLVDGFRADVAWGVPHGFWKEVRARCRERDAEFLLLDETVPRQAGFHEIEFDCHHQTDLYHALRTVGRGEAPATAVLEAVARNDRMGFPDAALHLHYVENHDEDRYLAEFGRSALKAAAAATVALPGVPMVYYGQERGMTAQRGEMRWDDGDDALTAYHRRLLAAHDEHAVIRRGHLTALSWEADDDAALAFALEHDGERAVVALNFGEGPATVTVGEGVEVANLLTDEQVEVTETAEGTALSVTDAVAVRSTRDATGTDRTALTEWS